ncbi:CDP-glucose 4,6-dehydratase [Gymnodinialimonas sp.]
MVTPLESAFAGKRVLLTGDTGFKGAWLALWLQRMGAEVHGLALPETGPETLFARLGLRDIIQHTDGDIRDAAAVDAAFEQARPEVVLHLAAQALVRQSYRDPVESFSTNVMGSINVWEATRRHAETLRALISVSSDKCYQNNEWVWGYRETDRLGGKDPYSASKAAMEVAFEAWVQSFFSEIPTLGYASVRAGNVIGGGDYSEDRITPDIVRALSAGQPVPMRNPNATRPWQHVLEPLGGYLTLAAKLLDDPLTCRGAWNFGPDVSANQSVAAFVETAIEAWGSGTAEARPDPNAPREAGLLSLNSDKAYKLLGWHTAWDFESSVTNTIDWYRAVEGGGDATQITAAQIEQYEKDQKWRV